MSILRLNSLLGYFCILSMSASAHAVIRVESAVTSNENGVRTQAVITEATGLGGGTLTAVAIKEVHAAVFIIDNPISRFGEGGPALRVVKRNLTRAETYGLGLPGGYNQPPITDPEGPWQGLMWPYRDQYDYFPDSGDPLGDDVGTAFHIEPDVYGFLDVDGVARGGPTDPEPAGGSPDRLLRGITGNGLDGPASYFAFDLSANSGDPNRFVEIRIISTTARVVVRDSAGNFSEITVPVAPFSTFVQLPEPAFLGAGAMAMMLFARRRRGA